MQEHTLPAKLDVNNSEVSKDRVRNAQWPGDGADAMTANIHSNVEHHRSLPRVFTCTHELPIFWMGDTSNTAPLTSSNRITSPHVLHSSCSNLDQLPL
jgi:hypothetical protein